jgi:inosine/xanthosine triphosphatase
VKIVVCTKNRAKIQAIEDVFGTVWSDIEIIAEKFPSDIAEQPISEEEGIQGAINRTKNAQKKFPEADLFVGMEGFVDTNKFGMFLAGVTIIRDKKGKTGIGISAKVQIPEFIKAKIEAGKELGVIIKDMMNDNEDKIRQFDGTNGVLTQGMYNRVDEFKDATKCALAKFVSPEIFN